jgi:hypothetical protein
MRCFRLSRTIRAHREAAGARVVYERPISTVAFEIISLSEPGKNPVEMKLPEKPMMSEPLKGWHSLEPVSDVLFGAESLNILNEAVRGGQLVCDPLDGLPDDAQNDNVNFCQKFFNFRSREGQRGIVGCYVLAFEEAVSLPQGNQCTMFAYESRRVWLVAANITPEEIFPSIGGPEGSSFKCEFKPTVPMQEARGALRTALSGRPLELSLRSDEQSRQSIVGVKHGGRSEVLEKIGRGVYYEKVSIFGTVIAGSESIGVTFEGSLSVSVNRAEAGLRRVAYDLDDAEFDGYFKQVLLSLSRTLGNKLTGPCEPE